MTQQFGSGLFALETLTLNFKDMKKDQFFAKWVGIIQKPEMLQENICAFIDDLDRDVKNLEQDAKIVEMIGNGINMDDFVRAIGKSVYKKDQLIGSLGYKLAYTVAKLSEWLQQTEDPYIIGYIKPLLDFLTDNKKT